MSGAPFSELHYRFLISYYAAVAEREKAEAEAAKVAYRRNATDDELVDDGIKGILEKRFDNSSKAAEDFYDQGRISGDATRESNITRIRKKIDKRLKEMSGG